MLLPFTYSMTPVQAFATLIGIFVGGISGGLITAILINIPGTPASIVTCWDGYPMTKQGRGADALSIGIFASTIGGLFSALVLILVAPALSTVALKFATWENFALGIMGLTLVTYLVSKNIGKGFLAVAFGMLFATVGTDTITGSFRFTFNNWQLNGGINTTSILMALFAIAEIMIQVRNLGKSEGETIKLRERIRWIPKKEDLKGSLFAFLSSSVIGTFIGILPGIGQTTGSMLSYNAVVQQSKDKDSFGKGNPKGLIASETANNAVNGGALVTLTTLGIPGDITTAVLLGAFLVHGLQSGPKFFSESPAVAGSILVNFFIANIMMYLSMLLLMKMFIKILDVKKPFLYTVIVLTCILGALTVNNRIFDVWVLIVFGIFGYIMTRFEVPLAPMILGYVLGPMVEKNFRRAMVSSQGSFNEMLTRPIAVVLMVVALIFLVLGIIKTVSDSKKRQKKQST